MVLIPASWPEALAPGLAARLRCRARVRRGERGFLDRIATEAPPQPDRLHIDRILLSELAGGSRSGTSSSASVETG